MLTSRGTYLHVRDECFHVKTPDENVSISPRKISSIVLGTAMSVSTNALQLANEHNIDVVMLDKYGDPYGRFWHCRYGSTAAIRRAQIEALQVPLGTELVKDWLQTTLCRRVDFLQDKLRRRSGVSDSAARAPERIEQMISKIGDVEGKLDNVRGSLMGYEGTAGRMYFGALSDIIPDRWTFEGRSHRPAEDHFNCFLNYAYGVLYGTVERALVLAGLDPYVGFLHTDNYGKTSLVFDFIEPYRPLVEKPVFHLFSGRTAKEDHCEEVPGGYTLNKDGKAALMEALDEELDRVVLHDHRKLKNRDTVLHDAHRTAHRLLEKNEEDFEFEVKEL
jgi:CRISPR-associated protein Cas1